MGTTATTSDEIAMFMRFLLSIINGLSYRSTVLAAW